MIKLDEIFSRIMNQKCPHRENLDKNKDFTEFQIKCLSCKGYGIYDHSPCLSYKHILQIEDR